ncbi:hypothetical protein [Streptomyces regalis]|uniref:hypothetical protein n=1 Tax=Streptomyces regalis TaxID=68262 RepID=UPI000A5CB009|nr:hypothetical protein [Streptomyces regalis]
MSGTPARPYLRLRVGGFECSLQDRPTGRTLRRAVAALLPLCALAVGAASWPTR